MPKHPLKDKPNLIIIGASGHAKVIIDIIERTKEYNIIGLIDSFKPSGTKIFNYKILGHEKDIPFLSAVHNFKHAIIAIGDNWTRKTIYEKINSIYPELEYVKAIHPKSIIGRNVKIGKGTVVMAGAIINSDARVGEFCIINTKASLGHDAELKKYSSLAPNATIGGNVKIGTCSAICLSASVIQDITIGKYSIIGAGSLVIRNIESYKMALGVPAKITKDIEKGEKYLYNKELIATPNNAPTLELITDEKEWKDILNNIGTYDFYHTYDYHMLSKLEYEIPVLIKYKRAESIIAIPLLIREIKGSIYRDATSAYGYVGPISKGISEDFDNTLFTQKLTAFFKENKIVSVFSRLNPYIPFQKEILSNFGEVINQGTVVNIDLSLDVILQRQKYRSRLKTHINKSRRNCYIKEVSTNEELQTYMDIYHENMDRVHAKESYYFKKCYFENLLRSEDFKSTILLAFDKETDKPIAGSLFIFTNSIVQYHLSGTKNEYLHLTPTKLLIDEMRLMATKLGFKYFNLGGGLGGRDDDNLFDFKASFSKDFKKFNLWELIIDQDAYDNLVKKNSITEKSSFFPLYRCNELNN